MTPGELKELVEKVVLPLREQIPGLPERRRVLVQRGPHDDVVVYFDGAVGADDPAADRECLSGGVSSFAYAFRVTPVNAVLLGHGLPEWVRSRAEIALAALESHLDDNRKTNAQPAHVVEAP